MLIVDEAARAVRGAADATTTVAGAVGGGVLGGVRGGIRGTTGGVRDGMRDGSHSTALAVLTMAAVGVAGVVEWPILLAVGGTAVVLHEWDRRGGAAVKDAGKPAREVKAAATSSRSSSSKREQAVAPASAEGRSDSHASNASRNRSAH